jgi:predicted RecB family endonuclease
MVEQILRNRGFETSLRQKLRGKSGAIHEIDIVAKRDNNVVAVECKNFGESRSVGIKELRDFHSKILDLPEINRSMFVTNIGFTSGVEEYAAHNNIELWNGEKLYDDFYHFGDLAST